MTFIQLNTLFKTIFLQYWRTTVKALFLFIAFDLLQR